MFVFNVILYLAFYAGAITGDWTAYRSFISQGAECYSYHADWGNEDPTPPPCFYLEGQ